MQVAERGVGEPGEHRRRDVADAADADVALGLGFGAAGDERVREHDDLVEAALARRRRDPRDRRREHRGVRALGVEIGHHGVGQQVRDAVDREVVEHDRIAQRAQVGAQVHAGVRGQRAPEAEPDRRVVVAAGQHDVDRGGGEPGQRLVEQRDRVGRRHRAVVDVAGDEHRVDAPLDGGVDQPAQERALVLEHRLAVQRAAQVPVGGVQQSHRLASMERPGDSFGD